MLFQLIQTRRLLPRGLRLPEDVGIQTSAERPLQGQCPYIINISIGHEEPNWGISSSVAYNIYGRRLSDVGNHGCAGCL